MWQCCEPSFVPLEPNVTNGECCKHRDHIPRKPMSTERNVESCFIETTSKNNGSDSKDRNQTRKFINKQRNWLTICLKTVAKC